MKLQFAPVEVGCGQMVLLILLSALLGATAFFVFLLYF